MHTSKACCCRVGRSEHSGQVVKGEWRLPGLGGVWPVEEANIRLPPLPPGGRFGDFYEVGPPGVTSMTSCSFAKLLGMQPITAAVREG